MAKRLGRSPRTARGLAAANAAWGVTANYPQCTRGLDAAAAPGRGCVAHINSKLNSRACCDEQGPRPSPKKKEGGIVREVRPTRGLINA